MKKSLQDQHKHEAFETTGAANYVKDLLDDSRHLKTSTEEPEEELDYPRHYRPGSSYDNADGHNNGPGS